MSSSAASGGNGPSAPWLANGRFARGQMRRRTERGLSDSVQWSILVPVLLLAILGSIQVAIVLHGRNVALSAAQEGADAASAYGAHADAAQQSARQIATDGGLTGVVVTAAADGGWVEVTVAGRVETFFDFGQGRITQRARSPIERLTQP